MIARLVQLWRMNKITPLTPEQEQEFIECMDQLEEHEHNIATLQEMSYLAYTTNDFDWLHDIVKRIDELELPRSNNGSILE